MTADDELKQHYLFPGNLFVHREPHLITTVLGSCVAVCLWDPMLKFGGMNHYMLPLWNGDGLASPKYGSIAIPKLVERMMDMGSKKTNLKAKVFGGGEVLKITQGVLNVGERNIVIARDMLKEAGIPIIGSDLGGLTGRKILFNTETGGVLLKRLRRQINDIKIINP
jgi:chemotaxis protein CheD